MEAKVNQKGKKTDGGAHVYGWFGQKDTYHFKGVIDEGKITASHYSGHSFRGTLTSRGSVTGVVRTKKGLKISVQGARQLGRPAWT